MFGKVMALPDEVVVNLIKHCTHATMEKVEEIQKKVEKGDSPKEVKEEVAFEVVKTYHDEKLAIKAKENFNKLFTKKEISDDIVEFNVEKGKKIMDFVLEKKMFSSKSEFRRLVEQGAVSVFEGEKIEDPNYELDKNEVIRIGKKNIFKIVMK